LLFFYGGNNAACNQAGGLVVFCMAARERRQNIHRIDRVELEYDDVQCVDFSIHITSALCCVLFAKAEQHVPVTWMLVLVHILLSLWIFHAKNYMGERYVQSIGSVVCIWIGNRMMRRFHIPISITQQPIFTCRFCYNRAGLHNSSAFVHIVRTWTCVWSSL
jgi:hypothetical protein